MTFRRLVFPILILFMAPQIALAGDTESKLRDLLAEFLRGASINDSEVHERFWAEDLIYTSSSGARFGKAEIMSGLAAAARSNEPEPGVSYSARDVRVQVLDETAVVTFQLVAEQANSSTELFYNTGVFRLIDGGWQALVWQATRAASSP